MTLHTPLSIGEQADLFGAPMLSGLAQAPDFISAADEAALIARIDAATPTPFRFQGWTGKRLTRSYGWSYDFETGLFAPDDSIPDWLQVLKAGAEQFAGLAPDEIVQALIIRYDLRCRHRLAQGSAGVRARHRHLARRPCERCGCAAVRTGSSSGPLRGARAARHLSPRW